MMPPPEFWWGMAGFTGWMGFLFCGFGWWGAVREIRATERLADTYADCLTDAAIEVLKGRGGKA